MKISLPGCMTMQLMYFYHSVCSDDTVSSTEYMIWSIPWRDCCARGRSVHAHDCRGFGRQIPSTWFEVCPTVCTDPPRAHISSCIYLYDFHNYSITLAAIATKLIHSIWNIIRDSTCKYQVNSHAGVRIVLPDLDLGCFGSS